MKKFKYYLAFLLIFLLPALAMADQWQIVGPRALGMGGAHVAVVNDATAQYWNPAAFGFFGRQAGESSGVDEHSNKDFGMHIHGGLGYQSHEDTVKEIEDLTAFDYDAISNYVNNGFTNLSGVTDYIRMIDELDDLSRENIGVTALVDVSMNVRVRNWGVGVIGTLDLSAIPVLDLNNINPGTAGADFTAQLGDLQTSTSANSTYESLSPSQVTALETTIGGLTNWSPAEVTGYIYAVDDALAFEGYTTGAAPQTYIDSILDVAVLADNTVGSGTFDNNSSIMVFKGAAITEIPITYGHAFNDNFSMGVNLKAMKAETYYYRETIYRSDTGDLFKNADTNSKKSSSAGLDLGALYKAGPFRVGIVGRNLNKPSFDYAGPGDYEIDPQLRAGAAIRLGNWLTLAADMDLTENDTNVSDSYKSKQFALGAEFDLLRFLKLRAGGYKNLSESDIGTVYTAGLGLNFFAFQLDTGVAWSKEKAEIEGDDVREEARGELALSFQF
ncbi:MAG: conjugal transfer protein TraF [Deltaproteobacteria bacterium]|nr:conjugal transfer protein TraF [Deltaproteobacteria bacterium]